MSAKEFTLAPSFYCLSGSACLFVLPGITLCPCLDEILKIATPISYVFRISGGNDKQGFPMKQGVLVNTRVRLLLKDGHSCFRERRKGCAKRKSVRGCVVGPDIAVLALVIITKGEGEIPGLTDTVKPRRLGPKRASKIKALFVRLFLSFSSSSSLHFSPPTLFLS